MGEMGRVREKQKKTCHSPILRSHEGVPEQPVGWPMVQPSSYSASSSGAAACMRALEARRPTAARAGARQRSVAGASGSRCARGVGAKAVAPAWRSGSAAPVCATTTTSTSTRRGISTIKKGSARGRAPQSTPRTPSLLTELLSLDGWAGGVLAAADPSKQTDRPTVTLARGLASSAELGAWCAGGWRVALQLAARCAGSRPMTLLGGAPSSRLARSLSRGSLLQRSSLSARCSSRRTPRR